MVVFVTQLAHPQQPSRQQIEGCLRGLEAAEFMVNDAEEPLIWKFCQVTKCIKNLGYSCIDFVVNSHLNHAGILPE